MGNLFALIQENIANLILVVNYDKNYIDITHIST